MTEIWNRYADTFVVARGWDDQHLQLDAAARQVGGATTGGFAAPVQGAAQRWTSAWRASLEGLGTEAETCADGIRSATTELLQADGLSRTEMMQLGLAAQLSPAGLREERR